MANESNGQCLEETSAVSTTISMRREPEVPEERAPVVEARITSKELAPIHSVKSGTLQNACSTRPRVVAELGESALMHIVKLTNSQVKVQKE